MSQLEKSFELARAENRALLIGYLPAGFPTLERSISAIKAMIEGGVDVIEVGLPYSDPVMDGPVIQQASETALTNGFKTGNVFEVVAASPAPTLVMRKLHYVEHLVQNLGS